MDEAVLKKIEQKIKDSALHRAEIEELAESLRTAGGGDPFVLGFVTGRIYNAFFYQSRRILGREPTRKEFEEFVDLLGSGLDLG